MNSTVNLRKSEDNLQIRSEDDLKHLIFLPPDLGNAEITVLSSCVTTLAYVVLGTELRLCVC